MRTGCFDASHYLLQRFTLVGSATSERVFLCDYEYYTCKLKNNNVTKYPDKCIECCLIPKNVTTIVDEVPTDERETLASARDIAVSGP